MQRLVHAVTFAFIFALVAASIAQMGVFPPSGGSGSGLPSGCTGSTGSIACDAGLSTGDGTATAGLTLYELAANGGNSIAWFAKDSLASDNCWFFPAVDSASGEFMVDAGTTTAITTSGSARTCTNMVWSDTAPKASALATNPAACSAGQYVSDIAADGTLTCGTPSGGSGGHIDYQKTTSNVTHDGTDKTVYSTSSVASPGDGKCVMFEFSMKVNTASNNTTWKLWLGATSVTIFTNTGNTSPWFVRGSICNDPSSHTSQQVNGYPIVYQSANAMLDFNDAADGVPTTMAEDWSSAKTIKLTAQGTASDTVKGYYWRLWQ